MCQEDEFRNLLKQTFLHHGFPLTDLQINQYITYWTELKRWNSRINLTSIRDDYGIIVKHFLDSLSVLHHFPIKPYDSVIDIGTGAGFPGVPIKIRLPKIRLILVESSLKKVSFLHFLIAQLRRDAQSNASTTWENVRVIGERAEECAEQSQHANAYDWVLTRYVASLEDSITYCLPLLKPDGTWIAYKSRNVETEIRRTISKLQLRDGSIQSIINGQIDELNRTYVAIRRIKELH
jgi:16S rRNA (guanine527-N7)-methyltransferase